MDTCIIYLLRHGATDNNLARPPRLQGCGLDVGLSADGRRQAEEARLFFQQRPPTAVISSPLRRARETAEIIAQPHGHPLRIVQALREADVGDWEGRSWEEIERDEPEAYRRFRGNPDIVPYTGGENLTQVHQRVTPAFEQLAQDHLGQQVVVVAHNVVNRAFLAGLLGLPLAQAPIISQDNCGINVLRWRGGKFKLRTWNSTFHLG